MVTSSFTTELKFDTEEKFSSFLEAVEAVENAKNNKHQMMQNMNLLRGMILKDFLKKEIIKIQNFVFKILESLTSEDDLKVIMKLK